MGVPKKATQPARKTPLRERFDETGICVFESRHDDDFRMRMTTRAFHKLALIRKGRGWIETPAGRVELAEHDMVFIPAGLEHRLIDQRGEPMTLVMSSFFDKTMRELPQARETLAQFQQQFPPASPFALANRHLRAVVTGIYRSMIFEQLQKPPAAGLRVWCHMAELMILLVRNRVNAPPRTDPSVHAAVTWLNSNFCEPVSVEDLAASAGMGYRRFTGNFTRVTGQTVLEYVTRRRVDFAAQMMAESGVILDSAYAAGFGDVTHFYRTFKKYRQMTPKAYLDSLTKHL